MAPFAGFLHHGAFLLAVVLIAWNVKVGFGRLLLALLLFDPLTFSAVQWQRQYADLTVLMQSLHYPMALWYLGANRPCILPSPDAQKLCVQVCVARICALALVSCSDPQNNTCALGCVTTSTSACRDPQTRTAHAHTREELHI